MRKTHSHKFLHAISPHVDTPVILRDWQSMLLQTRHDLVVNMELRILLDVSLDDRDVQPNLGMRFGPADCISASKSIRLGRGIWTYYS